MAERVVLAVSPYLSPASRAALDQLVVGERGVEPPPALTRVRDIRAMRMALDAEPAMLAAVRESRGDGETWEAIASAAGLAVSAAKWRWQGTDDEIVARHEAGRRRSARPSSVPTDLPGLSVAEAARRLGVTPQAVYLRVTRGSLEARTVLLADGRSYKRVFLPPDLLPDLPPDPLPDPAVDDAERGRPSGGTPPATAGG